jgi:hypothetical protein
MLGRTSPYLPLCFPLHFSLTHSHFLFPNAACPSSARHACQNRMRHGARGHTARLPSESRHAVCHDAPTCHGPQLHDVSPSLFPSLFLTLSLTHSHFLFPTLSLPSLLYLPLSRSLALSLSRSLPFPLSLSLRRVMVPKLKPKTPHPSSSGRQPSSASHCDDPTSPASSPHSGHCHSILSLICIRPTFPAGRHAFANTSVRCHGLPRSASSSCDCHAADL